MGGWGHGAGDTEVCQPGRSPTGEDGVSCLSPAPRLLLTLVSRNRQGSCQCDRRSAGPRMGTGTGKAGFLLCFVFPQAGEEESSYLWHYAFFWAGVGLYVRDLI